MISGLNWFPYSWNPTRRWRLSSFQSGKFWFRFLWRFLPAGGNTEARTSRPGILARSSIHDWFPPERLPSLYWFQSSVKTGFDRVDARVFKRDRKWWKAAEPSDTKTKNLSSASRLWTSRKRNSVVFWWLVSIFDVFSENLTLLPKLRKKRLPSECFYSFINTRTDLLGFKHWGLHWKPLLCRGSLLHVSITCWNITVEKVWQRLS